MIVSLDPISFTQGKPFGIDCRGDKRTMNANVLNEVKLQNQSPLPLVVYIGEDTHVIAPDMVDKFPLGGQDLVSVIPASLATAPATGSALQGGPSRLIAVKRANQVASVQPTASFALLVTISSDDSVIPGVYPAPLVPVVQTASTIINPSLVLTGLSNSGQKVIAVPDTSLFTIGMSVNVIHLTAPGGPSQLSLVTAVDPVGLTVTIRDNLTLAARIGDVLMVMPPISTAPNAPLSVNPNPSVVLAATAAAGQKVITVPDTSPFVVGQSVTLEHINPSAAFQQSYVTAVSQSAGTITILDNILTALAIGDVVSVNSQTTIPFPQWTQVGTKTTVGGGAENFTTSPFPPGAFFLGLYVESTGAQFIKGPKVVGVQSSGIYAFDQVATGAIAGFFAIPINPAEDQTYTVSWVSSSGAGAVIVAFASASPAAVAGLGASVAGLSTSVVLANDIGPGANLGLGNLPSWPGRLDGTAFSGPAVASKATVTLAANSTKRWVADSFTGSMAQVSGAATQRNLNLIDGASGGASILWGDQIALTATANTAASSKQGAGHFSNSIVNTAMTLEWDAAVAGTGQRVTLGAYLQ